MNLKGLLRIYEVKKARRYHKNPSAACTTKESLGPPALPELHLAQSTHLQATSLVYLCGSTCSSAGIPNASPFEGWPRSSSFQRLPCSTGCRLCCCGFQPSGLQPSGGKMAAAQRTQHPCPAPLWAGTYHLSCRSHACSFAAAQGAVSHAGGWIPPKIQVRSSPKISVTGDGLELATCYAQPRWRLMLPN